VQTPPTRRAPLSSNGSNLARVPWQKNEAVLYEPKYAVGEVLGPVQTKFGWHLIKIETRYIADFDYRLKEEGVVEL